MSFNITKYAFLLVAVQIVRCVEEDAMSELKLYDYKGMIEETNRYMLFPQLIKSSDAYVLHPEIEPEQCGDERCVFPVLQMTNFETGIEAIYKQSTILVVSGALGFEKIGISSIFNKINLLIKYSQHEDIGNINLNNLRIIFVPSLNPKGFYEFSHENKKPKDLTDALKSFNWENDSNCFESSGSKVLNHIFKENIIIGTIVFGNEPNEDIIAHPWMDGKKKSIYNSNPDEDGYRRLIHTIMEISKGTGKSDLSTFHNNSGNSVKRMSRHFNFLSWAYKASELPDQLNMKCLSEDSKYTEEFLKVDEVSNRAFTIEVNIDEEKAQLSGNFGNEMSTLNRTNPDSQLGYISRNIWAIRQLMDIVRPVAYFYSMRILEPGRTRKNHQLEITFDIRGCFKVEAITLLSPKPIGQNLVIENPDFDYSTMLIHGIIFIDFDQNDETWANGVDLDFKIECDSRFKNIEDKESHPYSHLMKSKFDSEYTVKKGPYEYNGSHLDLVSAKINKMNHLASSFQSQKIYNEMELINKTELIMNTGGEYPFILRFVNAHKMVRLELNNKESKIFPPYKGPLLKDIKENLDNLKITFFEDFVKNITPNIIPGLLKDELAEFKGKTMIKPPLMDYNDFKLDFNIKYGQEKPITDTFFLNLIGKQFYVDLGNGKGFFGVTEILNNVEQNISNELKLLENRTKKKKLNSLFVPRTGLYCNSSFNNVPGYLANGGTEYDVKIIHDPQNSNQISFIIKIGKDIKTNDVVLITYNQTVSVTKISQETINGKVYSNFIAFNNRLNFKILGLTIAVYEPKTLDLLFECTPQKSQMFLDLPTQANVVKYLIYDGKEVLGNTTTSTEEETQSKFGLYFFLFIIVNVVLGAAGWNIWNQRQIQKKAEVEIKVEAEADVDTPLENAAEQQV